MPLSRQGGPVCPFLWLNNIPMNGSIAVCLPTHQLKKCLGCFYFLAVVNSAALNIHVCFVSSPAFIFWAVCLGVELLGHTVSLCLS